MIKKLIMLLFTVTAAVTSYAEEHNTVLNDVEANADKQLPADQLLITEQQIKKLGIELDKIKPAQSQPLFYASGIVTVPPNQEVIVSSSQAGLIARLNVSDGDRVSKNQVLAIIDSPQLLALQRQYLSSLSELNLASRIHRRDKQLFDEGVISRGRYEQASSKYQVALAAANESRQLLNLSGMSQSAIKTLAAKKNLSSEIELSSPIAGVVVDAMISVGTRISPQEPLYRIANIDELWLEINIPQQHISKIQVGDRVALEHSPATAEVTLLGMSVDTSNQTVLMRAVVNSRQETLRMGQSITAKISSSTKGSTFKVPNEAIAMHDGKSHIFVRNNKGFIAVHVNVLGSEQQVSIIQASLTGTETIAVNGAVALKAILVGLGSEE